MIGRRGFISGALGLVAAALVPWRAPAAEPDIKELLGNPIIDDAPLYQVPQGHTAVVLTGLPKAEWRKLNDGFPSGPLRRTTVQMASGETVRFGLPPASLKELKREWREADRMRKRS